MMRLSVGLRPPNCCISSEAEAAAAAACAAAAASASASSEASSSSADPSSALRSPARLRRLALPRLALPPAAAMPAGMAAGCSLRPQNSSHSSLAFSPNHQVAVETKAFQPSSSRAARVTSAGKLPAGGGAGGGAGGPGSWGGCVPAG